MKLGSENVLTATVHEPVEGRWWADCALPEGAALSGAQSLEIGGATWVGTGSSTVDGGRRRVRIVGGKDGLRAEVRDKYYRGSVTLGQIATDLLTEAGEALDPASDGLTRVVATWQRFAGPCVEALTDLVFANRLAWRITRAGLVRLTSLPHAFPTAETPGSLLDDDGRSLSIAVESPDVEPGVTLEGHPIHRITWEATATRVTGVCHYHDAPEPRRVQDHRTIAEAGIDAQRSDGSLDVIAASRYGATEIPLYGGLPGVTPRVAPGGQTLLAYAGSPRRPIAIGHRGGGDGCKIGSLVLVTAIVSGVPVVVSGLWFGADDASQAAAVIAGAPPNQLIEITLTDAVQQ